MKRSPVIVASLIFLSFGLLFLLISTRVLLICLAVGGMASVYLLVSIFSARKSKGSVPPSSSPTPLLVLSLLFPLALAAILIYWEMFSIITVVLLTGLTLVFFYNFLTVPLALFHKHAEEKRAKPTATAPYPSVSVLVPAYNEEGYVGRCVESLLEAEYPEGKKEIIVVDDGSTDGTYEEAKGYEDEGVKVVHKKNGGKYSALNYGLMFADGEIVVTVDADSLIGRRALTTMVGRFQENPEIGAVAGNIKVMNRDSLVTKCQALEYITSINIVRRAFDLFGAVTVVPGVLGAFRRKVLESGGFYDPDTLTEDFDTTVKALKTGLVVQACGDAKAFTEAPGTWKDLYKQRLRWYRGNFMTMLKHRNVFRNPRFGFLSKLAFPYLLLSMIFIPIAGVVVVTSVILGLLAGLAAQILSLFAFFLLLQTLLSALAVQIDEEDMKLVAYSPLHVVGYKHFCDLVTMKSLMDVLLGREMGWTRAERAPASVPSGED